MNFDVKVGKDANLTNFDICDFCIPVLPKKVKFDEIKTLHVLFNTIGSSFNSQGSDLTGSTERYDANITAEIC